MNAGLLDNPGQLLVCVDLNGKETGKIVDRRSAHTTPGTKHLAIQVLVFNPENELVLHERPANKVGGGVLDAPTTHVLAGETKEEAAQRCLANEYGIRNARVKVLSGYSYDKDYGDGSCENEYCLAAFLLYRGKLYPNKDHAPSITSIPAKKVLEEAEAASGKYPVWLRETLRIVARDVAGKKFFI